MSDPKFQLKNPPIVEAIIDIDCDMPPTMDLKAQEARAREFFELDNPKYRVSYMREHTMAALGEEQPQVSSRSTLQGMQFLKQDDKQILQIRTRGFSFNRLAPYTTLDEYLPEIERTWKLFIELAQPVLIRAIRLRYINRILLPTIQDKVELDKYFKNGPRLSNEEKLVFLSFFNQHLVLEKETGNQAAIVLAAQPMENDKLPVILDITAAHSTTVEPANWSEIHKNIQSLRRLKNEVFRNTLTELCLTLFQ